MIIVFALDQIKSFSKKLNLSIMKNLSKVIVATAAGIVVGGALGLLFAPEKGYKTRKNISKKSKKVLNKVNDQLSKEKLMELKDEFESQLDKINDRIKRFAGMS